MRLFNWLFGLLKKKPPIILTKWGPTTERMRLQAALNMKADPDIKARVEALLVREAGGDLAKGLIESQRRFPEAYKD